MLIPVIGNNDGYSDYSILQQNELAKLGQVFGLDGTALITWLRGGYYSIRTRDGG